MSQYGAVQTSVTADPVIGVPGDEYDAGNNDVVSFVAAGPIPFGRYVKIAGHNASLPANAADITTAKGGIALRDKSKPSGTGYVAGDLVRVLVAGRAWVDIEENIADTDVVFVRHTAAGNEKQGGFRNDADTSDAATPPATKYFKGGTLANGGVAVLQVGRNAPAPA